MKDKVLSLFIKPIKFVFNKNPEYAMNGICNELNSHDYFVSYRLRPLKPETMIPIINKLCCSSTKIAIVMQGPISHEDNFTLETVKYYKKMYPDICIILSTWDDELEASILEFKKLDVIIVQTKKPDYSGVLNVNFQIVSTLAGINKAEELNAKYVIKTRTDQRVCKPYVFYSLCKMLEYFTPVNTNLMNRRILTLSTYIHNMFTPYFLCDFFYVGDIVDLKKFFSCNLDKRKPFVISQVKRREYSRTMYPPEIYLTKSYLKNYLGRECTDTVKEYWESVKEFFICVGRDEIGLFTRKYDYSCMDHINGSEYSVEDNMKTKKMMNFDFWMWFNLYSGNLKYKEEYEKETDVIF